MDTKSRFPLYYRLQSSPEEHQKLMSLLFTPITIRGETIPNRVFVSPMCQSSSDTEDGRPGIWHTIHYGTRAVGGAGERDVGEGAADVDADADHGIGHGSDGLE